MKKALFAILLYASIFNWCHAQFQDTEDRKTTKQQAKVVLQEAVDYVSVLPNRTLSLLNKHSSLLNYLNIDQRAEWYTTKALASVRTSDMQGLKSSIDELDKYQHSTYVEQHKKTIINIIGIWYRRNGFYQQAKMAYQCNLNSPQEDDFKVKTLLNLAVVERNLGNSESALQLNHHALVISQKLELEKNIAIISNNLGIFSFVNEDFQTAEKYFSNALNMNKNLMRRSGEILSGINLLHTFLRQNRPMMFNRLHGRIQSLLERYPNQTKTAYLNLISYANDYNQGNIILADARQNILEQHEIIADKGIQALLEPVMSELGISVTELHQSANNAADSSFQQLLSSCELPKNSLNS